MLDLICGNWFTSRPKYSYLAILAYFDFHGKKRNKESPYIFPAAGIGTPERPPFLIPFESFFLLLYNEGKREITG